MISVQAKRSINEIFTKAALSALAMNASDVVEITTLPDDKYLEPKESKIVVLTIASYVFRLMVILHVTPDATAEAYFVKAEQKIPFLESFGEISNLLCGAMNRELGKFFLHIAMSTPYVLENHCLAFIQDLKPEYLAQHRIIINSTLEMHATLCLCSYAPIDFNFTAKETEEVCGMLELF